MGDKHIACRRVVCISCGKIIKDERYYQIIEARKRKDTTRNLIKIVKGRVHKDCLLLRYNGASIALVDDI